MKRIFPLLFLSFAALSAPSAHGVEGTWKTYTDSDNILYMDMDESSVWCATTGDVVRWDKRTGEYRKYTAKDGLLPGANNLSIDRSGRVWVSCIPDGVCCFENGVWKRFLTKDGAPVGFKAAFRSRDGRMWFGGMYSDGVYCFDGAAWKSWKAGEMIRRTATSIAAGPDGTVWFATNQGAWSLRGHEWKHWMPADGLGGETVNSVAVDREGVVWFATNAGLSCYNGVKWKTYHSVDGMAGDTPLQVVVDRNNVKWIRTLDRGVSRFDGESWKTYTVADGLPANRIAYIAVDLDNRKWFCPNPHFAKGATSFDDSIWVSWTTANSGLAGDTVKQCFADSLGNTWFVTDRGISCKAGSAWTTYGYGISGAPDSTVCAMASTGKIVWFGTENGLLRFENGEWKTLTVADGLPGNAVTALAPDGVGHLWIAPWNGICRYDSTGFYRYPEKDRLLSNSIEDIAEDDDGGMWFATRGGLSHFDGAEWRTYTTEDGLDYYVVQFLDRDRNGTLLVRTGSHLYRMGSAGLEPCGKEMIEPGIQRGWLRTNEGWLAAGGDTGTLVYHIASGTAFTLPEPEPGTPLGWQILFENRDTFWMQSMDGLTRFDGGRSTRFRTEGLPYLAAPILDGVVDHHNRKWFISQDILSRYDGKEWSFFSMDSLIVSADRLTVDSEDHIWIQGEFNISPDLPCWYGLLSFNGVKWEKHICDLPCRDRFSGWEIIADRSGAKWIAGSGKLLRYADGKWEEISAANTVGPGIIFQDIAIDGNNLIWVGTSKGVYTFDGVVWKQFHDRPGSLYGEDADCLDITVDSRGEVWMDGYRRLENTWKQGLKWSAIPPRGYRQSRPYLGAGQKWRYHHVPY